MTPADATAAGNPAATAAATCPDLVGRSAELDHLTAAYDRMTGGRAGTVLIGGEAGVGKSRLVEEFCDQVRLRGDVVAVGRCVPAEGRLPYAPIVGLLRDLGRRLEPAPAAQLLQALRTDASAGRSAAADPGPPASAAPVTGEFARTLFFDSVLESLAELAGTAPVLVVFDDLQWVDASSAQLIDFLVRNLGDARVLILGTYRTDDLTVDHPAGSWLAELGRHPRVTQLELPPLDRAALAALIGDHLGRRPDPELLESAWTRSQGNPFFAEQLLAAPDPARLPHTVQAVIGNRLNDLTPQTQSVLGIAAAAGAGIEHRLLAAVDGSPADVLERAVAEAVSARILVVDESGSGYLFRHALLREAVYATLLPAHRSRLHHAVADALTADASLGPTASAHRIAELAGHRWAAGDWAAALEPSLRAADAAMAVQGFREALGFLEQALLADERASGAAAAAGVTRATLLERAADVAYLAGVNARAVELAEAAVAAVDAALEPVAAARCYTLLGRNVWGIGDSEAAFDAYGEAIRLLPSEPPSVELARALAEEARGDLLMSLNRAGEQRAGEAIAVARAVGARDVEGHAINTLGCCRANRGFYDEGIALVRQSLAIAEDLTSPDDLNRAYGNLTSLLLDVGRLEDAASIMFDSAAVGEELWGLRLNGAAGNGVDALVRLGRYREAEDVLAQLASQALGVCAPAPWTLPSPIMIRQGDFDVAEELIATAREMTARLQDVQQSAWVLGLAAELDLERGQPDEAAVHLDRALALAARSEDETLVSELCMWAARAAADRCEAARTRAREIDLGRLRDEADQVVATAHGVIRAREQRGAGATVRNLAAHAQAVAEQSRLEQSDPRLWDDAAGLWAELGERYPLAYCRWRQAEALLESRSGRGRAAECLDQAWLIGRELGAAPLCARLVSLARRGRLDLCDDPEAEPPPAARVATELGLTAREVEVLAYVAAGHSDREIGDALFISRKTVSVHVSNVLRKLAVANRVEAGRIGQAHGLGR